MNLPVNFGLTEKMYAQGLAELKSKDERLEHVLIVFGKPPLWAREPGFATLIHIILEQQVSLASARAAFDRLQEAANPLTPQRLLRLDDDELRQIGFSRQKAGYARGLSKAILQGEIDLQALESQDDDAARAELMKIRGIGTWTADIYLLVALGRPDIWPRGDLALIKAYQKLHDLPEMPSSEETEKAAESWKPWRAVAARILWHYYLSSS